MSLTHEQSAEVYKKAVVEQSKAKYTESPTENISIKEKIDFARKEHGVKVANKIAADHLNKKIIKTPEIVTEDFIVNKTDHLINYDLVDDVVSLQGSEYTMMKKDIYKQLLSLAIPEDKRIIQVGKVKTDMRVHTNNVLSSGKGKKNLSMAVKNIYLRFNPGANIKEPRTIHYQHLIGKMLLRKTEVEDGEKKDGSPKFKKVEEWVEKRGFLNADLLILEEAVEIMNSQEKNDVDCRDALTVALDCYGENLIMKQNMDNLDTKEETLAYHPYVTVLSFLQPVMVSENFVVKGYSRRVHTNYKEFPDRTGLDKYADRLISSSSDEESINKFAEFMHKINNVQGSWKLEPEAIDSFLLCHAALLEQGFRQGGKVAHYTRILEYPMQNILLKMSALQSISNLRTNITKEDVELAFVDVIERLTHEFKYIEKKVKGSLDYGEGWAGATGKIQKCLEELYKLGAENKETSIPIWQFQKIIEKVYDISNRRARDKYKSMKAEQLIEDYLGQGKDNGVWLNFEPKIKSAEEESADEKINPLTLYNKFSGRTQRSGRTPKTGGQLIGKTELSISIDNSEGKKKEKKPSNNKKKVNNKKKLNNTLLGVQPVQPVQSDRDTQYWDDPITSDIKPCDKKEVQQYVKSHPKTNLNILIKKFGPGVMKLKLEGLQ